MLAAAVDNAYVPAHLKDRVFGGYLVVHWKRVASVAVPGMPCCSSCSSGCGAVRSARALLRPHNTMMNLQQLSLGFE
jgi:hypothetical protein